jgi:hypothetical protein
VKAETREWQQARRAAFVHDVLAAFTRRPADLLPFEEVRQKLRLIDERYLGLQDIALDNIVGSVGRYQDFTRAFGPRQDSLEDRWRRIQRLSTAGGEMPPIELYKVGQVYFVRDGNHRVSVARQQRIRAIRAHVWEFETHLPLQPDTDVDELLCSTAHAAFERQTQVARLCPDVTIRLTEADAYEHLLAEIGTYQRILCQIDERQVPFDEAVVLWCEMRYTPIVEIIRQRDVLQEFPGRTETDLYLWLCRNQQELEAYLASQVLMAEAADDLAKRFSQRSLPVRRVKRTARRMAEAVAHRLSRWQRAACRALWRE